MPGAKINMRPPGVGSPVSAVGPAVLTASPADARKASKQQQASTQQGAPGSGPRNTAPGNVVCWTPCGQRGAIVLGADPDPAIRAQLLRDASRYFGGGDH